MRTIGLVAATVSLLWLAAAAPCSAKPFPAGSAEQRVRLGDITLTVFTYRPACRDPSLLLVFHGQNRNADDYRDWARPLADKHCLLVAAPRFGKERFPRWRYQHGGIARNGVVQSPDEWTGRIAVKLAERIRRLERRQMPYALIGHSAGGQYLSRLAAFSPTQAQRIVIANPGTHVLPDAGIKAPYGFGGVYADGAMREELRRYLSQPITIFLGQDDTDDEGLSSSAEAQAQGATRYARGLEAFKSGQALARSLGLPFHWRLIELKGVGHKAREMFAAPEASAALKP